MVKKFEVFMTVDAGLTVTVEAEDSSTPEEILALAQEQGDLTSASINGWGDFYEIENDKGDVIATSDDDESDTSEQDELAVGKTDDGQ